MSDAADHALREAFASRLDPTHGQELRDDPVAWVTQKLNEEMWSKQVDIMTSVRANRKTAVKSCHGVGKSHIASRVCSWWLDTNPTGDAFVVTTAPTFPQVKAILWRYIGQAHRKGELRGRVNLTEWYIGDELVGFGRKPSDYDEDGFQGIHAPKVLVVIDEACGVPFNIWVAVDSLVTNDNCRVLAIGNPDNPESHFADVCEPNSGWNVITISAFDSPNFTDEVVSQRLADDLVGQSWVEDAERSWGKESPLYVSKVLGQFPKDASDGVIPGSKVALARAQDAPEPEPDEFVQLGVDCGAGGDQSVIRERRGSVAGRVWRSRHDDPMLLVSEILRAVHESGARKVAIDSIGIGWGVMGSLREKLSELGLGVEVVGINVGESPTTVEAKKRYYNLRAQLWWEARESISDGKWNLAAIDDQTAADLTAPKYTLDTKGKIVIESKDDMRKRLGRSPDDGDAILLAYCTISKQAKLHKPRDLSRPIRSGAPGRAHAR